MEQRKLYTSRVCIPTEVLGRIYALLTRNYQTATDIANAPASINTPSGPENRKRPHKALRGEE